ncbi:hypothetical protein [Paenibacillus harenae]|uniref:Uncharacterized protein n=1 Tax=Paenibacillus harenae TaxID=306543 RepID=A0ABT9U280_PAEHA|nr:hypothetical protein [Paenibacillus harenae]MDQ0113730.1 hypothetical protein [Paenibacillus harenae]
MALVVFCSISVLLLLSYSVTKRRLHLFERIVIWVFVLLLQNNFIWMMGLNYKLVELSHHWLQFLVYDSIRSIIVPICMMLYLELHEYLDRKRTKGLIGVLFIMGFVGIEYLAEWLGVLSHSGNWSVWYSVANWVFNVLLTLLVFKRIRFMARKEVTI